MMVKGRKSPVETLITLKEWREGLCMAYMHIEIETPMAVALLGGSLPPISNL